MPTPKQALAAHLHERHNDRSPGTHNALALHHKHLHDGVMPHTHASGDGWRTGGDLVTVAICLIKPKNPGSSKAEDRNWTLQIAGHRPHMVQFVRLYGTRDGDGAGAVIAAEQWLGWGHGIAVWAEPNAVGTYEVKDGRGE